MVQAIGMGGPAGSEFTADTWLALIAGAGPWASSRRTSLFTRLLCVLALAGLALVCLALWIRPAPSGARRFAPIAGTMACTLLAVPVVLRWRGHVVLRHAGVAGVARGLLAATVALSLASTLTGWSILYAVPLGLVLGADVALTCSDLGWVPRPRKWMIGFMSSGFHLGVIGALIGLLVTGRFELVRTLTPLYATMIATLMLGLLSADVVARFERETDEERQTAVAETIQAERRQRAHWLHDDVCAELRLVSLKVQTEDTDRDEVVRLLDQFDHRLRLRQLDELFAAGPTRIAELLQPFIRHAQNMGIDVDEVPSFEDASSSLAPSDARLFARLVSVTTSNSINAGATRLAYAVHLSGREVSVTIRDNGPGFEVSQLPFGRALWSLRRDLSPGVLEIRSAPGEGTEIVATLIPVELPRRLDRRG